MCFKLSYETILTNRKGHKGVVDLSRNGLFMTRLSLYTHIVSSTVASMYSIYATGGIFYTLNFVYLSMKVNCDEDEVTPGIGLDRGR